MIVAKVVTVDPKVWERKDNKTELKKTELTEEQLKNRLVDLNKLVK